MNPASSFCQEEDRNLSRQLGDPVKVITVRRPGRRPLVHSRCGRSLAQGGEDSREKSLFFSSDVSVPMSKAQSKDKGPVYILRAGSQLHHSGKEGNPRPRPSIPSWQQDQEDRVIAPNVSRDEDHPCLFSPGYTTREPACEQRGQHCSSAEPRPHCTPTLSAPHHVL